MAFLKRKIGEISSSSEYEEDDNFEYMKSKEGRHRPSPTYLDKRPLITPMSRERLVNWLVDVHGDFELEIDSIYLAVNLVDRFLSLDYEVSLDRLQLLGTAALLIASKFEAGWEHAIPPVSKWSEVCNHIYTNKEIVKMEEIILRKLDFELLIVYPTHFVSREFEGHRRRKIMYFIDLTLQHYHFLKFRPSVIAAAAVFLSSGCGETTPSESEISECVEKMTAADQIKNLE